jgi:hypothetical protein
LKADAPPAPDPEHPVNQPLDAAPPPTPPAPPTPAASEVMTGPPLPNSGAYRDRLSSIMTRAQQLDHER